MELRFITPLAHWQYYARRHCAWVHPGYAPIVWVLLGGLITSQAERRRRRLYALTGRRAAVYYHRHHCPTCGQEFWGSTAVRVCERVWCLLVDTLRRHAARRRGTRPGTCEGCRGTFTTRRRTARFCRPACKQRAYRRRVTRT